jgi:hypothetical protein
MQVWKIFSEGGVDALEQQWDGIKSFSKKRSTEKKQERKERVISTRLSAEENIPRPREMQGLCFFNKFNFPFPIPVRVYFKLLNFFLKLLKFVAEKKP